MISRSPIPLQKMMIAWSYASLNLGKMDWIVYFSVLMITVCKEQKDKDSPEIQKLLLSILEELKRIADVIKTYNSSGEHRNKIRSHLLCIRTLLHDPNAFYGEAAVPIGVGVGTLTVGTLFSVTVPVLILATVSAAGIVYLLQRKLNEGRNIIDELKHAIKRALEQLDETARPRAVLTQGDWEEIGKRIEDNARTAKQHLAIKL